jgi:nucleoid-associated protein YgaU
MQRRSKILVIALVVCLAGGATYFFRKRGPTSADVLNAPEQAEVQRRGVEKPAPQSHLLGEIQAADQPAGSSDLTPIAPSAGAATSYAPPANPSGMQGPTASPSSLHPAVAAPPASVANTPSYAPAAGGPPPFASSFGGGGASETLRHRVVDGDTLTALAERYLGSANRYLELYELNRDKLASPDLLPIGAELKVPARGLIAPPPTADAPQPMVPLAPAG